MTSLQKYNSKVIANTQKYGAIVTEIGKRKVTNAVVNGREIKITQFAYGDGGGSYYVPDESMISLKHEVWRGKVVNYMLTDEFHIEVVGAIPPDVGGFVIREMAVFDEDNQMIAICNCPDVMKATVSDGVADDSLYALEMSVTNVDAIKFNIDPTVIHATKKELQIHIESLSAHPNKADKDLGNVTASSILEKLKSVDGAGSGLDADTVGGKHAIELQDYNKLNGKLVFNNQIGVDEEEFNKYNGAEFAGCNIDIRTWHGVGIRSTCNNPEETSSIVFDAREGTIKTIGEIYADRDKKVWHEGNDGSGSGLDADTIDGKHASDLQNYLNLNNSPLVFYSDVGGADFGACNVDLKLWDGLGIRSTFANPEQKRSVVISSRDGLIKTIGQIYAQTDKKVWHEGNDGSGSGLDADTVDGKHAGVLYSNCSAAVPTSYLGDNVQYQVY